jgi:hypothetical protein
MELMEACLMRVGEYTSCGLEKFLGKMVLFLFMLFVLVGLVYVLLWLVFMYHDFNLMKSKITELENRNKKGKN